MNRGIARRPILSSFAASPLAAWLTGCGSATPTPPSTPVATPPDCVDLSDHRFVRSQRFCSGTSPDPAEGDMQPIDFFGPLVVSGSSVATFYIDAVAEFELRTGTLQRLLATRRSDSRLFAAWGNVAVTPRCDGVLVVHRNGCQVGELVGHTVPTAPAAALRGLRFVSENVLVSLGADTTVRSWDVDTATLLTTRKVDGDSTDTWLRSGPSAERLVISHSDSVTVLSADNLSTIDRKGPFAATSTGWYPMADSAFVGISAEPSRRGLLFRTATDTAEEFVDTHDSPRALAVSAQGVAASIVGLTLFILPPDGQVIRRELTTPLHQVVELDFTPDGAVLVAQDAATGVHTIEVASGRRLIEFERKA